MAEVGVTELEISVTVFTVSVVDAENPPTTALMVVDPFALPVARPPGELMLATFGFDEVHVAVAVRSRAL